MKTKIKFGLSKILELVFLILLSPFWLYDMCFCWRLSLKTATARLQARQAAKETNQRLIAVNQSLAVDPNDVAVLIEKGRLFEALRSMKASRVRLPLHTEVPSHGDVVDVYERALRVLDSVLGSDPNNALALTRKGMALDGLGRSDESIAQYDRAIALDHSLTLAWLQKGSAYTRLDRPAEALQCYEQALALQNQNAPNQEGD